MRNRKPLFYLVNVSERPSLFRRLVYSIHLTLDKRIELVTACYLLPHKAEGVPVCLQRTGRTKAVLTFP